MSASGSRMVSVLGILGFGFVALRGAFGVGFRASDFEFDAPAPPGRCRSFGVKDRRFHIRPPAPARAPSVLWPVVRNVGFLLLVLAGMAILAAVVYLPDWAKCLQLEYQRDCERAYLADTEALLDAYRRKIRTVETDAQLTRRLAQGMQGTGAPGLPIDRAMGLGADFLAPGEISVIEAPLPKKPNTWLMDAARKVEDPPTRRGLLLLFAGAITAAVYLFDPGGRRKRKPRTA